MKNVIAISLKNFIIILICTIILLGCDTDERQKPQLNNSSELVSMPPIRVVVIADKTGSTLSTRTEQVSISALQPIFDRLLLSGGELRIGFIQENSNRPFLRVRIEMPPSKPVSPRFSENPFEKANQQDKWNEVLADWQKDFEQWKTRSVDDIDNFKKEILPYLESPPNRPRTDVFSALIRADVALSEQHRYRIQPKNTILFATDGEDNQRRPFSGVHSGASIIVANGDGNVGVLNSLNPEKFESISAAIQYISSLRIEGR